MTKENVKKRGYLVAGLIWPFLIMAICDFIHVHIQRIPDWTFFYLVLPLMALGLIPIMIVLTSVLPQRLPASLRWCLSILMTGAIGFGLFYLVMLFMLWFHFAIGGTC